MMECQKWCKKVRNYACQMFPYCESFCVHYPLFASFTIIITIPFTIFIADTGIFANKQELH